MEKAQRVSQVASGNINDYYRKNFNGREGEISRENKGLALTYKSMETINKDMERLNDKYNEVMRIIEERKKNRRKDRQTFQRTSETNEYDSRTVNEWTDKKKEDDEKKRRKGTGKGKRYNKRRGGGQ